MGKAPPAWPTSSPLLLSGSLVPATLLLLEYWPHVHGRPLSQSHSHLELSSPQTFTQLGPLPCKSLFRCHLLRQSLSDRTLSIVCEQLSVTSRPIVFPTLFISFDMTLLGHFSCSFLFTAREVPEGRHHVGLIPTVSPRASHRACHTPSAP